MEGTPFETFAVLALSLAASLGIVWAAPGKPSSCGGLGGAARRAGS